MWNKASDSKSFILKTWNNYPISTEPRWINLTFILDWVAIPEKVQVAINRSRQEAENGLDYISLPTHGISTPGDHNIFFFKFLGRRMKKGTKLLNKRYQETDR